MYSYGSSARVGVGKQGHGGRPYRPPRKTRDPSAVPPPLKECSCLVEMHLPEYSSPQPNGRQHECFGGRQVMERSQHALRSDYQVHLMIPGRNKEGPVSLVAKTYREALPALAFLFEKLIVEDPIRGRFHRNVKDSSIPVLEGIFPPKPQPSIHDDESNISPFWLFESASLSVLTCSLLSNRSRDSTSETTYEGDQSSSATDVAVQDRAMALQTCLDNIVFRLGKEAIGALDIFLDPYLEYSFAAGNPIQAEQLRQEILTSFQSGQQSNTET